MFQTFDANSRPDLGPPRVKAVRGLMAEVGVDAVLVPRADEHQGEYVPASAERLQWLTGFTGSAGFAIVGRKAAALFTDGRYTLQAGQQVDTKVFEVCDSVAGDWVDWLARKLPSGGVVGFDPWLHTRGAISSAIRSGKPKRLTFKALPRNLVDAAWGRERPRPPLGPIGVQAASLAGRTPAEKIADIQKALKAEGETAVVLTLPDSICWLLNIRGADIPHNPVVLAFMIVPATGKPELFVAGGKITREAKAHLQALVTIAEPKALLGRLAALKAAKARVRIDPGTAPERLFRALGSAAVDGADPCILPKARKTDAELAATRAAHIRDAAAVVRFLAWLEREAPNGTVDEISAVKHLEACRAAGQTLKDISFPTISGSGPNGAIVHYRVTTATNRKLKSGELFLVDSGGQYVDGTTDITRTVVIGKPSREMRERFTLVLKGHIALATARFPVGTRGVQLDTLARHALWQAGLDYDHGTGHGVGAYLSVHEGPQSISKRGMAALEPGMIVSNEPGYYETGRYGIRIENLEVVTPAQPIAGGNRDMLGFETLTLVPMDRRLIADDLLTPTERIWLDRYHARVAKVIGPELAGEDRAWLAAATAPL